MYPQNVSSTENISFEAKVVALQKLGVIQYLQKKCTLKNPIERDNTVASFIRLLIDSDKNISQIDSSDCKTILQYIVSDKNSLSFKNHNLQLKGIDLSNFK